MLVLEHRARQLVLAADVVVERALGDAGPRRDGIHARGLDTAGVDQLGRGREKTVARRRVVALGHKR
jgi:hypothetical protein